MSLNGRQYGPLTFPHRAIGPMRHFTLDLDSLEVTTFEPAFSGDLPEQLAVARPSVAAPCTWEYNSCYVACISFFENTCQ